MQTSQVARSERFGERQKQVAPQMFQTIPGVALNKHAGYSYSCRFQLGLISFGHLSNFGLLVFITYSAFIRIMFDGSSRVFDLLKKYTHGKEIFC